MSNTNETRANAALAIPRKLLDGYLREAAARLAQRRDIVGTRIREAREAKGWLQKDLAGRVHVEPQTISNWERSVTTPDFDKIELLARELDQPVAYFVSENAPTATQVAEEAEATRDLRILVDALLRDRGLDPEQILRDSRLHPEGHERESPGRAAPGEAA